MSKHADTFELQLQIEDSFRVCREAVANLGWRVLETDGRSESMSLTCKEAGVQATSFTWPAQIEIALVAERSGVPRTRVSLYGSIFGFGPIQFNHLKGQMGNLRNRIELLASNNSRTTGSGSKDVTAELEKLADFHAKGILTDEEFRRAKERLLDSGG